MTDAGWLRRLSPYLFRNRASVAVTVGAALVGMIAQAATPLVMQRIVDDAILGAGRPIGPLLGVLLALGALRFGVSFVRRYFGAKVGVNVDYDLRNEIYDHLHRLDFTRHDEMETGQLVSRANADVQILQRLLSFLPVMSANLLLFPVSLVFMVTLSVPLTLVASVTVPVFLVLTMRLRKVVYPSSWDASQKAAAVAGVVDEAVSGVRIVRAFGQEQRAIQQLAAASEDLYGSRMRNIRLSAARQSTLATVPMLGQAATLAFGGWLAIDGRLTVGAFLAFSAYLTQLVAPIGMTAMMLVMAQMARASAERINEILDSTPEITDVEDAVVFDAVDGSVELRDITFGYLRSKPVLAGFDLRVAPGETVALVGASGSGKSTVSMLVPRFYDVQAGSVLVDGVDVRNVSIESLRANIGVVFEDSFLFSDTIRNNIAYGHPDATDGEVEAAARAAEAHEFVCHLPAGYDTVVGEQGLSLSGGQRQRIALARALITDPRILLLDDATSSIDVQVEESIHETLRRLMRGRTTILVAHRRSSLALADRIVVVGDGCVVDQGSHDELMTRCALYRQLLAGPAASGAALALDVETEASSDLDGAALPPVAATTAPRAALTPYARGLGVTPDELRTAISHLPPIIDRPEVDIEAQIAADSRLELRRFARPFLLPLLAGLGLVVVDSSLRLAGPYLIRWGVDHGIIAGDESALWSAVAAFVAAALLGRALHWLATVHMGRIGQRMLYALRIRVFAHLHRLGLDYYDREMAGRVMTRMTSDIDALNALLQSGLVQAVVPVVTLVGTVVILLTMDVQLTLVVLLVAPPLVGATLLYRSRSNQAYTRVRDGVASVNASFQESVSGLRVAKAFGRERTNMTEYRQVTGEYLDARLDSSRIASVYFPFVEAMSVVATVLVLGFGARQVTAGSLTAGSLIAFALYITTVFAPLQQLSSLFDTYQQARAALRKLQDLLATQSSIPEAEHPVSPPRLAGAVRFEDVCFGYGTGGDEVLRGVSVDIPAGQRVALVGPTGAGKSTFVKLVARFYDPTSGTITVDGYPLVALHSAAYRRQLGYVPQEPFLFSGTIRDNIAYGRPGASDADVREAAVAVGAAAFIEALPGGYDEPVTERGRSLSAGQRQLVALARALLVDPAILLLDEATANLDLATEAQVTAAMDAVAGERTSICIAHRLSTAHACDRIIVIDDGRIVESGTPHELVARGGRYAQMWQTYDGGTSASSLSSTATGP